MTGILVLIVLGLGAVGVLAAPMLRRGAGRGAPRVPAPEPAPSAESALVEALREIEFDHAMGKLSQQDYDALRTQYEERLAGARAARQAPAPMEPAEAAARVAGGVPAHAAARTPVEAAAPADPEERAEWLVRRARAVTIACPDCGVRPEPDARYCSNCGRYLARCPSCGRQVDEIAARFCSACGGPLGA